MIGRRAVLGLSLLSALMFCAFAAQSAAAATAENTTAFTCVKVVAGTGDFTDAHCDKTGKGDFAHQSIAKDTTTNITATNDKMGAGTSEKTSQLFKMTVFAVKVEITCKELHGFGIVHNVENVGKHTTTGLIEILLKDCEVKKPLKCTLKEIKFTESTFEGVEGLGAGKNEMGVEVKPKEGTPLATVTLEGSECVLKGKPFKLEGTMIGTSGTGSNTAKETGATVTFTEAMSAETMKVGGNPVEHKGGFTVKMEKVEDKEQNPIAFTTTT